jgi:hypothetical protein
MGYLSSLKDPKTIQESYLRLSDISGLLWLVLDITVDYLRSFYRVVGQFKVSYIHKKPLALNLLSVEQNPEIPNKVKSLSRMQLTRGLELAKDVKKNNLLVSAIAEGNATRVDELITAGISLYYQNELGSSCLHEAVLHHASTTVLDILISAGADPDVQDASRATPLLLAVRKNDIRSVDFLLTYGADINIQDAEGWSPLLVSLANNFHELMKLLLSRGAVCSMFTQERSILHVAAMSADVRTMEILSEAGLKNSVY